MSKKTASEAAAAAAPTPFEAELAEFLGEAGAAPAPVRDHVSFRTVDAAPLAPLDAAEDFVRHIRARTKARAHFSQDTRAKARTHVSYSGAVTVRVSWQGDRFRTLKFSPATDGRMLASHNVAGGHHLSAMLHDWLTASDRFAGIGWRTREEWQAGAPGHDAPL